jgi:hypothetical protein
MDNLKTGGFHPKPEHRSNDSKADHRSNAIPPVELSSGSAETRRDTSAVSAALDLIGHGISIVVGIFF